MEKYLSDPFWLLGAFGWIVGIISGFLQVKSYIDQKKYENAHKIILDQIERDWKGKYTQEQIDSMVKEVKRLEESINRDVPKKARRVFLEDQLSALTENMAQGYTRYNEILVELKPNSQALPERVQRVIEKEIMPIYLEKQRQQRSILLTGGITVTLFFFVNLRQIFLAYKFGIDGLSYSKGASYPFGWVLLFVLGTLCFAFLGSILFEGITKKILSKISKRLLLRTLLIEFGFIGIVGFFSLWVSATKMDRFFYEYVESNGIPAVLVFVLAITTFISGLVLQLIWSLFSSLRKSRFHPDTTTP